jgi:hypothetical protein
MACQPECGHPLAETNPQPKAGRLLLLLGTTPLFTKEKRILSVIFINY